MPNELMEDWGKSFCGVCGKQLDYWNEAKRCNDCRQVENRLGQYLKNPKGQEFARNLLPEYIVPEDHKVYVAWVDEQIAGVFKDRDAALKLCKYPKEIDLRYVDDWLYGCIPDAWDYEAILKEYGVQVLWNDKVIDSDGQAYPDPTAGWTLTWKHGFIWIGKASVLDARKAAAMFIILWQKGVSASLAGKLMVGYLNYLKLQTGPTIGQRAYKILKTLNDILPLGDLCYDVRESEGKGWDGPKVVAWGDACSEMWKLFKETE